MTLEDLNTWLLSCNLFLAVWFPRDNYSCITVCALAYIHEDISDSIDLFGKLRYKSFKKCCCCCCFFIQLINLITIIFMLKLTWAETLLFPNILSIILYSHLSTSKYSYYRYPTVISVCNYLPFFKVTFFTSCYIYSIVFQVCLNIHLPT